MVNTSFLQPDRTSRFHWFWLLLLTALLYIPGTGDLPLMDRDEPRFARATVEMMERGDWLIPYFNEEYRFDKPPLTYWWMRLHYNLLGINELAARLHSIVATWLIAWVVFLIGRDVSGTKGGWLAAFGWLTCLQVLVHGRLCVADMPMVLAVSLAMRACMKLLIEGADERRAFNGWWWVLWGSLGAGFLAKGPIALLVPALALILWRWALWRRPFPWRRLHAGWGCLLFFTIIAAWGIPALVQTQGLFWKIGMGEHVVKRGTDAFNGRVIVPFYYVVSALLSLFPWLAVAPFIWKKVRANWSSKTALLTAWLAAPHVIFFFYATQLPHYVMPGFPAFFALLGLSLGTASEERADKRTPLLNMAGKIYLIAMVAVMVTVFCLLPLPEITMKLCLAAMVGIVLSLAATAYFTLSGYRAPGYVALAVLGASLFIVGSQLRLLHPVIPLQPALEVIPKKKTIMAWRYTEPGLVYYAGHPWKMTSKQNRVEQHLHHPRSGAVILLRREWTLSNTLKQMWERQKFLPSTDETQTVSTLTSLVPGWEIHDARGLNLARSSWVELRLLVRKQQETAKFTPP